MNYKLCLMAFAASLGGLLSGYDTGVISGALLYINQQWQLNVSMQGLLVSAVLIGALLGAAINGRLCDVFGRKKLLISTAVIFFAGSLLCAFALNVKFLIFSRIFCGIAVGMVSFAAPLYLSEVSPAKKRGMFVSLYQLSITGGILFSYIINAVFANTTHGWRIMLLAGVVPAGVLFLSMLFLSDTPRWLVSKSRYDEAKNVFCAIEPQCDPDCEVEKIKNMISTREKFVFKKWMIMPFVVGIGIMFAQICTGVNTIFYYAPTIFKIAGFDTNLSTIYATGIIGIVNFLMTFIAIKYSDTADRKPLLYCGLTGIMLSLCVLSYIFANIDVLGVYVRWGALFSLIFYIVCFSFSLGPVGMILISEVFPLRIRGIAMSICIMFNFIFNFAVTYSFPVMLQKFGPSYTFAGFVIICIVCIIFVYFFVPETKGVTLEKIESNWLNGIKPREF